MPGGNTSSRKQPYRVMNRGSQNTLDVKAANGADFWTAGEPDYEDREYGINLSKPTPEHPESTETGDKWIVASAPAAPMPSNPTNKGDSTPGGGW